MLSEKVKYTRRTSFCGYKFGIFGIMRFLSVKENRQSYLFKVNNANITTMRESR